MRRSREKKVLRPKLYILWYFVDHTLLQINHLGAQLLRAPAQQTRGQLQEEEEENISVYVYFMTIFA